MTRSPRTQLRQPVVCWKKEVYASSKKSPHCGTSVKEKGPLGEEGKKCPFTRKEESIVCLATVSLDPRPSVHTCPDLNIFVIDPAVSDSLYWY